MISSLLTMAALLQAGIATDTVRDPVAVYAPILEQALRTSPARPGLPVALSETAGDVECTPHCAGSAAFTRRHSADVVRELQARGLVQTTCESKPGYLGCPSHPKHLFVALSPVLEFPSGAKMKPVVMTPGESVDSAVAAVSDQAEVPVDARVDVVVFAPCSSPASPDRCRHPDAVGFRYFLQARPDGEYRVVARLLAWQT